MRWCYNLLPEIFLINTSYNAGLQTTEAITKIPHTIQEIYSNGVGISNNSCCLNTRKFFSKNIFL